MCYDILIIWRHSTLFFLSSYYYNTTDFTLLDRIQVDLVSYSQMCHSSLSNYVHPQNTYYRGKEFVTYFFIQKPYSILHECWCIYCPGTLLEHLNLTPDLKMPTLLLLTFTQKSVILNKNSRNLMENSMSNSQIMWVI